MGDILFIGGDRRMICAAELISQSGGVCAVGLGGDFPEPENQSGGYERIVLPVPFPGTVRTSPRRSLKDRFLWNCLQTTPLRERVFFPAEPPRSWRRCVKLTGFNW